MWIERLHVPLSDPDPTLGDLRTAIAQLTSLDPSAFKLIYAGAQMKDDAAHLSAYGLTRPGATVTLIGSTAGAASPGPGFDSAAAEKVKAKERERERLKSEDGSLLVIRDELARVDGLRPALDTFLALIRPTPTTTAPTPADAEAPAVPEGASISTATSVGIPTPKPTSSPVDVDMEHRRLGEEFLQALLRLDTLTLDGTWTAARAARKGAIKSVQQLLDQLDSAWRERKQPV